MPLADTHARFSIPPLGDAPTNPIVDNLSMLSTAFTKKYDSQQPSWTLSPLERMVGPNRRLLGELEPAEEPDDSSSVASSSRSQENKIDWANLPPYHKPGYLAWNAPPADRPSAFASERQAFSWYDDDSASSSTCPISARALTPLLVQVALGSSIADQVLWNEKKKRFEWIGQVDTLSRTSTKSFVAPFLETGTYLIRLSELAAQLAVSPLSSSSTHAFSHALSSYLTFLRDELQAAADSTSLASGSPSRKGKEHASSGGPVELQRRWKLLGEVVSALAELGGVDSRAAPKIPTSLYKTTPLLSRVYCHLTSRVHSGSSLHLQAALAWLLDRTSVSWVDKVSKWIGLLPEDAETERDGWQEVGAHRVELGKDLIDYRFDPVSTPAFVPDGAARDIFEAGRSLRLLRQARPDHPLCKAQGLGAGEDLRPRWLWAGHEIEELHDTVSVSSKQLRKTVSAWRRSLRRVRSARASMYGDNPTSNNLLPRASSSPSMSSRLPPSTGSLLPSASLDFATMLDMCPRPPGAGTMIQYAPSPSLEDKIADLTFDEELNASPSAAIGRPHDARTFLAHLLASHPSSARRFDEPNLLPSCAPTLPILTSLTVFPPLLSYGGLVSQSLLSIFFNDLNLLGHLEILNRFLLLADPAFTSRVKKSVFGDGDNLERAAQSLGHGARSRTRARLGMTPSKKKAVEGAREETASEWGVGLGLGLSERQSWPPGGAELALALKSTMLDSVADLVAEKDVEARWNGGKTGAGGGVEMWAETEKRVGFAIRDVEEAGDAWKDPQAIEALDFLYIKYTPPPTIAVLFPDDILAKYHKIQTFFLRLLRVETVARSLYTSTTRPHHDSRPASSPFRSSEEAQRKLFALRIHTSHFVNNLAGYVFDTAIGRNYRIFVRRLDRLRAESQAGGKMGRRAEEDEEEEADAESEPEQEEDVGAGGAELKDVLSLVAYHSTVLDRMLAACFLRTKQLPLYSLLMRCFTLILTFGKLVRDLETEAIDEEDAYPELLDLADDFSTSTSKFLAAVTKLESRTLTAVAPSADGDADLEALLGGEERSGPSGTGTGGGGVGFADLIMRLDWRGQSSEQ